MGTGGTNRDRTNGVDLIQLFHIREAGDLRLMVIAAFEHLMQIHPSNTLGRFMGVVIVVDVDHQGAQQITHFVCHFHLQLPQLTRLDVLGNVVVGQEGDAGRLETLTNPGGDIRAQPNLAVAVGRCIAGTVGGKRDCGGHGRSFRRRRQPA